MSVASQRHHRGSIETTDWKEVWRIFFAKFRESNLPLYASVAAPVILKTFKVLVEESPEAMY